LSVECSYRLFDGQCDSLAELTSLLHAAYARLGAMGLNYTAVDQSPETTAKRMAQGECWLAIIGREIVGTVVLTGPIQDCECVEYTRADMASLHQFAVSPAHQGLGVGRGLIELCERRAREQGYAFLALDTAEEAAHLRALYGRSGFVDSGHVQWPGKRYRSVVMLKQL
jgi:GNAT superfamily N-acetyltransferase